MQRQRRRPGVPGRFIQWGSLVVSKTALDKNRGYQGKKLTQLAEELGKHVADTILDLAVEEKLETEFQLQSRPPENDVALAEYVRSGHALPSQSDAGAHLNTNYCTAGESSWVLGEWVRDRGLLSLEDAIRRYTFQPARIMGLRDRGLVREGYAGDLTIFDPHVVRDESTFAEPHRYPIGIPYVVVNGAVVVDGGRMNPLGTGRVLTP